MRPPASFHLLGTSRAKPRRGLEVQLPPALPGLSERLPLRVSSAGRPGSQPTGRGSVTSQSPAPARLSLDLWFPRRG